ncbi:MAG TPA: glycosyltransferase family 87 protein [Vicinamibacterales bacterium]|nr:glycosyltransferase family 87 protein [Vicinamibacterales bacterium]HOQ59746.1 glycosyltransferase family 87 protein [Vicinamibacterales bacterium]
MKRALPCLGALLLVAVAAAVYVQRSHRQMRDFEVYRVAGVRAAAGQPLYRESDGHWMFKYLPAFALLVAPLAQLPSEGARALWFALTIGAAALFVRGSLALLPARRRAPAFVVGITLLFMAKHFAREIGLGQSNALMAVTVLAALTAARGSRHAASGAWLAAAAIIKPYALIFLPWLVVGRRWRAVAAYSAVAVAALAAPALRYGWAGNLAELRGWWTSVTSSTAPNLTGQDTVSLAGMFAAWVGTGPAAAWLASALSLALVILCARVVLQGRDASSPDYLDAALLLFVIPLLSPQGWDYVLLLSTPAVMLLVDRLDEFRTPVRVLLVLSLAVAGLSFWDVLGPEAYRALMMSRVVTLGALLQVWLVARLRARGAA